jgi:hypothetical protein
MHCESFFRDQMMQPILLLLLSLLAAGCALNPPKYSHTGSIGHYEYVIIEPSEGVNSMLAISGDAFTRNVNPGQLIEGVLLKKGLVRVSQPSPRTADKLLLARYGVSGKRDIGGGLVGYAQEVTISLIDADDLAPVFTCTAEGIGATEADDIREAILSCLAGLE